jgi:hypothetical protein
LPPRAGHRRRWRLQRPACVAAGQEAQKAINQDTFERTIKDFRTAYDLERTDAVPFIYVVKDGFDDDLCRAPTFEGISSSAKWNAFVGELNVTFYLAYSEAAAGGGAARTGNRKRLRSGEHVS